MANIDEILANTNIEDLKISPDTIVRTVMLFVTLINAVCAMFGWNPLEIDQTNLYQGVSALALTLSSLWAWWKNNSFTQKALIGDEVKNSI